MQNGRFGRGSGPILYADVNCGGLEPRLFDCSRGEVEETNCGHGQDSGIVCQPGMPLNGSNIRYVPMIHQCLQVVLLVRLDWSVAMTGLRGV